jgi:hypothetical protein
MDQRTHCLHLQGKKKAIKETSKQMLASSLTVKIDAVCSTRMSVNLY